MDLKQYIVSFKDEVIKIHQIRIIDGVPYIVLKDGIFLIKESYQITRRNTKKHSDFTEVQNLKSRKYFNDVREELKKLFGEQ